MHRPCASRYGSTVLWPVEGGRTIEVWPPSPCASSSPGPRTVIFLLDAFEGLARPRFWLISNRFASSALGCPKDAISGAHNFSIGSLIQEDDQRMRSAHGVGVRFANQPIRFHEGCRPTEQRVCVIGRRHSPRLWTRRPVGQVRCQVTDRDADSGKALIDYLLNNFPKIVSSVSAVTLIWCRRVGSVRMITQGTAKALYR
jgi:hypothetical protein